MVEAFLGDVAGAALDPNTWTVSFQAIFQRVGHARGNQACFSIATI